ncbi:hypothetical protein B0H21DRAFT_824025 [Amylocystis lapponica]|nr:hypothetical protein B0H21DRAFT_824025 [Amylocystis lapponica]
MTSANNAMEVIDWFSQQAPFREGIEERAFDGPYWDVVFGSSRAFNDWLCEDPLAGPSSNTPSPVWDGTPSSASSSLVATPSDVPQYTWADEPVCEAAGPGVMQAGAVAFPRPFEERGHIEQFARDPTPTARRVSFATAIGAHHTGASQSLPATYVKPRASTPPASQSRARRAFHPYLSTGRVAPRAERGLESVTAPTIGIYEHFAYVAPQAMVPIPSSSAPTLPAASHEHVRGRARSPEPSINGQVQCLWRNCPQWMAPEAVAAHICHAHNAMAGLDKDGRVKCRRCPSGKQCTGRVLPENFAMHIWRVHFQDKFIFSG